MNRPRIAVIGAGHLGRIHTRLLRARTDVELVGVVEPVAAARDAIAQEFSVSVWPEVTDVLERIDAAVVATPTHTHRDVALTLAQHGIHLFVEKPITTTVAEANELIDAAHAGGLVLQVGHVERFNPALVAARPQLGSPRFLDAVRASGYTFRSTDVGVVLDLMIHDLDVILSLVPAPVVRVDAVGAKVFGPHEDMAQARLEFANGCVANLSASRVSFQPQRTLHVYTDRAYALLDFAAGAAKIVRPDERLLRHELDVHQLPPAEKEHVRQHLFDDLLRLTELPIERRNAIQDEHDDFLTSIRAGHPPQVTGEDGRYALSVAATIVEKLSQHTWTDDLDHADAASPAVIRPPQWPSFSPTPRPTRKAG